MLAIARRRTLNTLLATTASIAWLAVTAPVHAQSPQAPTVAAGSIAIVRQGATTVINQTTDRGIIDWRSFSIGAGEAVRFDQPGRSSVTLNRVTGSELSRIDGNLSANGQVWLANPNGVLIGNSGQVNVGGLLATTGRVDATEFLKSGRAAIDQIGKDASIANFGTVNIAEGGYAALAAASIRNEGVVAARKGSVALGAGKAVTVDFTGDKLITFQVTQSQDQAVSSDNMISVGGKIAAEGGTVLMSARAAKGVMDNVVNLKGHVVANSVKVDGGTVSFGDGGIVQVSGKIDASNAAGKGGEVAILGEKVGLMDGASVDASGALGGGTVLVGGDWQGKGSAHNATIAYVAPTASINVDATMAGDGGKAVVWADDTTRFNGSISARGGVLAGDGGQVETSGKRALHVAPAARVTTKGRAAGSRAGTWLLDPTDITIVASDGDVLNLPGGSFTPTGASTTIDVSVINAALNNGDNVTLQTASAASGAGDITFSSGVIATGHSTALTLKLLANRDITFKAGTAIKLEGAAHNIVLNAAATAANQASVVGGILIDGASITTTGGSIAMVAGAGADLYASASSIVVTGTANGVFVRAGGLVDAGAGSVLMLGAAPAGLAASNGQGVEIANATVKGEAGITLKGVGSIDASAQSYGVFIWDTSTIKTKAGALTIEGKSAGSAAASRGVSIDKTTLSVESGPVSITGTGGPGGVSWGVSVGASTLDFGSGSVSITGTAGGPPSISGNDGVLLKNAHLSLTGPGAITLKGVAGAGGGAGVNVDHGTISIESGVATIQTNSLSIGSSSTVTATGGGSVNLRGYADTSSIGVGGAAGDLQVTSGILSKLNADLLIGGASQTGEIKIAGGTILQRNTSFQSASGAIGFLGAVDGGGAGLQSLTVQSGGLTTFGGAVGGATAFSAVNVSGALRVTGAGVTTTGAQSYGGAVALASSANFFSNGGNVTFAGPINAETYGSSALLANLSGGTLSLVGGVGQSTPLDSLQISNPAALGGAISTVGEQSYGGPVTLMSDAFLASGNAAGLFTFGGSIGGAGKALVLSTNGVDITLPTMTVANLNVKTSGGSVSQSGPVRVTSSASIDAGSGGVTLGATNNKFTELGLKAGAAAVTVTGDMKLSETTLSSLTLTTTGAVTQTGPLSTSLLSLNGSKGIYGLINDKNNVGSLTANASAIYLINGDFNSLEISNAGVTVATSLILEQLGAERTLAINGPIDLGTGVSTFTAGGLITGAGVISASAALLNLSPGKSGGAINTSGAVTLAVHTADINVNGVLISPTPPTPTTATTTASNASGPSVASVPSVAPTPTQASQASTASGASVLTESGTPGLAKIVEAETTPTSIGGEPVEEVVGRLIVRLELSALNGNNSLASSRWDVGGGPTIQLQSQPNRQTAGGSTGGEAGATVTEFTALQQFSLVDATSAGALIPPTPILVAGTGAPLAAANTIKVDAADTGGANGQVVARSEGALGGFSSLARGSTTVLPGLLVQSPHSPLPKDEPPLSDQPPTINEEYLLD